MTVETQRPLFVFKNIYNASNIGMLSITHFMQKSDNPLLSKTEKKCVYTLKFQGNVKGAIIICFSTDALLQRIKILFSVLLTQNESGILSLPPQGLTCIIECLKIYICPMHQCRWFKERTRIIKLSNLNSEITKSSPYRPSLNAN